MNKRLEVFCVPKRRLPVEAILAEDDIDLTVLSDDELRAFKQLLTKSTRRKPPLKNPDGWEWRCYMLDPDEYLIEVEQYTQNGTRSF